MMTWGERVSLPSIIKPAAMQVIIYRSEYYRGNVNSRENGVLNEYYNILYIIM